MKVKPKIRAGDAARDIRSGLTDAQMMEKYGLSAKGLQSLILKLLEVKAITPAEIEQRSANYHDTTVIRRMKEDEFIEDVRLGMPDPELMKKYSLSSDGLRRIFHRLLELNAIRVEDLYGTSSSVHDTVFVENLRELPRHYLAIAVDVYESQHPENTGLLTNITERGLAVTGIPVRIGESKVLSIPAENFIGGDPIAFEAKCRWVNQEKETGEWVAGFEITKITDRCSQRLRWLIEALPFLE